MFWSVEPRIIMLGYQGSSPGVFATDSLILEIC